MSIVFDFADIAARVNRARKPESVAFAQPDGFIQIDSEFVRQLFQEEQPAEGDELYSYNGCFIRTVRDLRDCLERAAQRG